ncbi:MAG: helix-turn-helix domain-containing protein [Candidatus Nanopelagicales bacterium]
MDRKFLTLADVADVLNVSAAQAYALVRSGDLRAIKVGGRGQWRVADSDLEDYIQRMYAETEASLRAEDRP